MRFLAEYHLIEDREVVFVQPFSTSVTAWLLPRRFFESYDFTKRLNLIHKELHSYEINFTLLRVLGFA